MQTEGKNGIGLGTRPGIGLFMFTFTFMSSLPCLHTFGMPSFIFSFFKANYTPSGKKMVAWMQMVWMPVDKSACPAIN